VPTDLATEAPPARSPASSLTASAEEAAELLGVSRRFFYGMHSSGKLGPLPVIQDGRFKRWLRRELEVWLLRGAPPRTKWLAMRDRAMAEAEAASDDKIRQAVFLLAAELRADRERSETMTTK
jgi:predicted DNA-binding transcriptional regulator AlpA